MGIFSRRVEIAKGEGKYLIGLVFSGKLHKLI